MLKDVFGFAEHQEKAIYGLGHKLTLRRDIDEAVIDKAGGTADASAQLISVGSHIHASHIPWYVAQYTPSIQQQSILSKQFLSKTPTELKYNERSVFMKEVKNQKLWNFELGSQERMNVPIWVIIGFQQQDRQDSQNLNNDTFCWLPVTSCLCKIGTEKYPGIFLNYDDDNSCQGCSQFKEAFRAFTKDNILQPYISDDDFRSSKVSADDIGYNLYYFEIRYQQNFTASQPFKVELKFDGFLPNVLNGYALVLTNKLVSTSSDGNRHFDLL